MSNAALQCAACELLNEHVVFRGPEICSIAELLPDLLHMVAERRAEPTHRLRPAVRRLIAERAFACPCDSLTCADEDQTIDAQADLLVRVLEQIRRRAVATGQWSEMPAAPVMCG